MFIQYPLHNSVKDLELNSMDTLTMEPYEIDLCGEMLTIFPKYDGTYDVFQDTKKIVTLFPDLTAVGVAWEKIGAITYEYANKIVDLIMVHEL